MSDEIIMNKSNVEEKKPDPINQYGGYEEFMQQCSSDDLKMASNKFAECGFKLLKETITYKRMSIQDRIFLGVKSFKERLSRKSAAIAEFDTAYSEGGIHGGRSLIREAINALFNFYVTNFPRLKKILTSLVVDVVKGKRFIVFCDESVKLVNDIVLYLKSDKESWGLLREACANFVKETGAFKKEITEPDPLEFTGILCLYDHSGKLLSVDAITKQYNEMYCDQLRGRIRTRVIELKHRYDEEFTKLLKTGIPTEQALLALSKKYNVSTIPAKVLTENEIENELKSNDPEALKALFEHLV